MTWTRLKLWFARKRIARLHLLADRWLFRARAWRQVLEQANRARDGPG